MEMKNAYKILVGKPEGKRPVGSRRRWEDIKMGLGKYGCMVSTGFIWLIIGFSDGFL
jgi:hypothetical protein